MNGTSQQGSRVIWVSYSQPAAERISADLSALGHHVICEPATSIRQLIPQAPVMGDTPKVLIFLSQHAVSGYVEYLRKPSHDAAQMIAIGSATASALARYGIVARTPDDSSSEAILKTDVVKGLQTDDLAWVLSGEGGRDLVENELGKSCRLERFVLYRRERRWPSCAMETLPEVIWVGSVQGLQQVCEILNHFKIPLQTTVVVPSQRVANAASELGFDSILISLNNDADSIRSVLRKT